MVRDEESLSPGDTTWVTVVDTLTMTVTGKHAEVEPVLASDTLDLGAICLGDTARTNIMIQNIGGCVSDITLALFIDDGAGAFVLGPSATFPVSIARGARGQIAIEGRGIRAGVLRGIVECRTPAEPQVVRIPVKLRVDVPTLTAVPDTIDLDTVCPGTPIAGTVRLRNATACVVVVDSVTTTGDSLVPAGNRFSISAQGAGSMGFTSLGTSVGPYQAVARVHTAFGVVNVVVRGIVAERMIAQPTNVAYGDVRVGTSSTRTVPIVNTGTVPVTLRSCTISGPHAAEYSVVVPAPLPLQLNPGTSIDVEVISAPTDIETRTAVLSIRTDQPLCAALAPVALRTRGIQPLFDVVTRSVDAGARCLNEAYDTVIVVRNAGNASLTVTAISWTSTNVSMASPALPFVVDSGSSVEMRVRITPGGIGPEQIVGLVEMDGDWLTPVDTIIGLRHLGTVCGRLVLDTIRAEVGSVPTMRVTLLPRPAGTDVVSALNAYGGRHTFTLLADPDLVRFRSQVGGGLSGANSSVSARSITVDHTGVVGNDAALISVPFDLLLSSLSRAVVAISVDDFVDGYHDLDRSPGLVVAEYCAKDERLVRVGGGTMLWQSGATVKVATQRATEYTLVIYAIDGREVYACRGQTVEGSTSVIDLPALPHGPCVGVLTTQDDVRSLIIRGHQ